MSLCDIDLPMNSSCAYILYMFRRSVSTFGQHKTQLPKGSWFHKVEQKLQGFSVLLLVSMENNSGFKLFR